MARGEVTERVETMLRNDPKSRDSDRRLIMLVWRSYGLKLTPEQYQVLATCPKPETIRRVRQKFQEEGKYPASPEVAAKRRQKSLEVEQRMPSTGADRTERLLEESGY